ncbi:trehalase [Anoxybacter fermentans]|uniref:Trehalase n=1 Tax=Anoxybacter fermentans TaxID=1323375 RepID=A0A3Q9HU78_9FIRM|nr:glycoside hydrolase family 65 protein [Anoxybacter fermentans]AZR74457.1 trehalase [Anoxybacter fermentans]
MAIKYNHGKDEYHNWLVTETNFDPEYLRKIETIFTLGNGYMGVRAATEEHYIGESRGCYIAGLFDEFPGEVTELANIPDWLNVEIILAGERFDLTQGKVLAYQRILNLKDGQLIRDVEWQSPKGKRSRLIFKRFVSLDNIHVAGMQIKIIPLNYSGKVEIQSGLNGQVTNSGVQHFIEGDKRVFSEGNMYITCQTQESNIIMALAVHHRFFLENKELELEKRFKTDRRQLFLTSEYSVEEENEFVVEKFVAIYTGRDSEFLNLQGDQLKKEVVDRALKDVTNAAQLGYDELFNRHRNCWHKLWNQMDIKIDGPDFDQLAIRFAQFHLYQMTPVHDSRLSVAAKGLSGEGYKGHVFWDTEIFILPFFIYTFPQIARNLLFYRYHTLNGARKKACESGYKGAMYAWESAITGEETTPKWGGLDLKTGEQIRIWCGEIEQHITCDVAYAIWHYLQVTNDYDFMFNYGAEIFMETARFWASRVEYNEERDQYEINDVIGPDEYSEHVNNNAYTNYMVKWHLNKAIEIANWLKKDKPEVWREISKKINISDDELKDWQMKAEKIYVSHDEESGLIEQFDGFMEKKEIDITPFKGKVGAIAQHLSWEEIKESQVLKQADVVMLLYLLGNQFTQKEKKVNYEFYEPKTLHDSSLSPSIHAILAADIGDIKQAYKYFERASRIDLGENPKSSDAGLHAASLGGIWQAVVNGFGGVRVIDGELNINPRLPEKWEMIKFPLTWAGKKYEVEVSKRHIKIKSLDPGSNSLKLKINGQQYLLGANSELGINF